MEVQQTFTFKLNANNGWYDSLQSMYTVSLWYITFCLCPMYGAPYFGDSYSKNSIFSFFCCILQNNI